MIGFRYKNSGWLLVAVGLYAGGQVFEQYASNLGQVVSVAGAIGVIIAATAVIFEFEGKANG